MIPNTSVESECIAQAIWRAAQAIVAIVPNSSTIKHQMQAMEQQIK